MTDDTTTNDESVVDERAAAGRAPHEELDVVANELPGVTIVEASAGTGKTHRITTEAIRAIAEGTPLESMLLVTFTIAATSELRSRTWERLQATLDAITARLRDGATATIPVDAVSEVLVDDEGELQARGRALEAAAAHFDRATILTIHGFCKQVLRTLGFAADVDLRPTFVEDERDLRAEVVADALLAAFVDRGDPIPADAAARIADAAITNPRNAVVPDDGSARPSTQDRVDFAARVRASLDRRVRDEHLLRYDDLLLRVRDALADDDGTVRDRLRRQFRVVMVDEFQDTDAIQWEILRSAFGECPDTRLVLVGDPKQAIYAFRGADVHAYLSAKRAAGAAVESLDTSYRADPGVLRGLDVLFGGAALGHDDIRYASVTAPEHRTSARLRGAPRPGAVRVRVVPTEPSKVVVTQTGIAQADSARAFIVADVAADIVSLLSSDATVDLRGAPVPVAPRHIAVLVGENRHAEEVRDALVAVGVPAVVNGSGNVFASAAATAWLDLLDAIENPASSRQVARAAIGPLIGWRGVDLDAADDDRWHELHARLHRWRRLLRAGNLSGLFAVLGAETALPARLLGTEQGARMLTDLRHVAELLQEQVVADGPTGVGDWLAGRVGEATEGHHAGSDEANRRLETDDDAVQVWTIHRSKGLEYPVVYAPFLWTPPRAKPDDEVLVFHDADRGERVVDVGTRGRTRRDHVQAYLRDEAGGALRLAYVGLTRAATQVIVHWARGHRCQRSPLSQLLLGEERDDPPEDVEILTRLDARAAASDGALVVEEATGPDGAAWTSGHDDAPELRYRRFGRSIDRDWRRTSYSALTAVAHDASHASRHDDDRDVVSADTPERDDVETPADRTRPGVSPEHDERGLDDEVLPAPVDVTPFRHDVDDATADALRAVPSPFDGLGGGAQFGTLVHGVLEDVDFTDPNLHDAMAASLATRLPREQSELDRERLLAGLEAAVHTPLGPLAGGRALRDISPADRLDEMHFELPLAGGDTPEGAVTMAQIAAVVDAHLPAGGTDLLAGYGRSLADPLLATRVRGYLSGAIDVVARFPGVDDQPAHVVIDHKSNWLGAPGEGLTAWHYRPAAVLDAMVRAHYPFQALLYTVALHRFLRWRLPDYDPDRHLGGVLYLFLRGMTGPDVPVVDGVPCGVFSWRPPTGLVVDLSDVLDGSAA